MAAFHGACSRSCAASGSRSRSRACRSESLSPRRSPRTRSITPTTPDPSSATGVRSSWIEWVLLEFSGWYCGKTSPVHLFWHGLDLAVTRFSGDRAPALPEADAVTREAYSHEVISFGFWPGDENVQQAAFYSYTAPEPSGLTERTLAAGAEWTASGSGSLALLPYDDGPHGGRSPRDAARISPERVRGGHRSGRLACRRPALVVVPARRRIRLRIHTALTETTAHPPLGSDRARPSQEHTTPADGSGTVKKTKLATILVTAACAATALTALATTTSAQTTRADGQAVRGGTYRVDWEVVVRLQLRLRSDGRVLRPGVRPLLQPPRAHARGLQPRRRARRQPRRARSRDEPRDDHAAAGAPTRSSSSRAFASGRR